VNPTARASFDQISGRGATLTPIARGIIVGAEATLGEPRVTGG
jgi:hypothetical protein